MKADRMQDILECAGAPFHFSGIDLDKRFFLDAITHARKIRNRYTFLDLAADAGIMNPQYLV